MKRIRFVSVRRDVQAVLVALAASAAGTSAGAVTTPHPGSFATIGEAIQAASPGDTVLVSPGRYVEKFRMKNGVTLRAALGPDSTILVSPGGAESFMVENLIECPEGIDSTTVIEGFSLDPSGIPGAGIHCESSSPTIRGNVIRRFGWGIRLRNSRAIVEDNLIEETSAFGILISASSPTIRRNEIRNNRAAGIEIAGKESFPVIGGSLRDANKIYSNAYGIRNGSRNDLKVTFNDWGWETTEEMNRESYPSDIITLVDGNDFGKTHRGRGKLDYRDWIKPGDLVPASNAPGGAAGAGAPPPSGESGTPAGGAGGIGRWVPIAAALVLVAVFAGAVSRRKRTNERP